MYFVAAAITLSSGLSAQVQKGGIYPGVTTGVGITRFNNSFIQPSVEVGISGHQTAGVFYYSTRYNNSLLNSDDYSTKRGGGISFTHYRYFGRRSKWGWYVNAAAGIYDIKVIQKQAGAAILNNRYRQGELTLTPGIFFTPSPRVMFFANTGGFALVHNKHEFANAQSSFLNYISVGVRFTLGGRKKDKLKSVSK